MHAGQTVSSSDLRVPLPEPLACDPNHEYNLSSAVPYVVHGAVQHLVFELRVLSGARCDYVADVSVLDSNFECTDMVDGSKGGYGVTVTSRLDTQRNQNTAAVAVDLSTVPPETMIMMVGVSSCSKEFSAWPDNSLDVLLKGGVPDTSSNQVLVLIFHHMPTKQLESFRSGICPPLCKPRECNAGSGAESTQQETTLAAQSSQ